MNIHDVVATQQVELRNRQQQHFTARQLAEWTKQPSDLIRVILGPRRAGKSMLAIHLLEQWGGGGYLNFDDERLVDQHDADTLIASIDALYQRPRLLLFDEVQNFPRWELLVNRLQREGRRVLVTGSNANLLGAELATHLTGRHQAITLLPFSYAEVLSAEADVVTDAQRAARLERYLSEGGYPEPLLRSAPRVEYLRDLVRATLLKDIVRRHRLRAPGGLEALAYHLFSHVAHRLSARSLVKLGVVASPTTATRYLRFIEEVFLIFALPRFSFKAKERIRSESKIYAIDPALAATLGTRPGSDRGRLAENVVACSLWHRKLSGEIDVGYWQNAQGEEVDFVVRRQNRIESLIQVCWSLDEPQTAEREWRALLKAAEELRCSNLVCLHQGPRRSVKVRWHRWSGEIELVPLTEWLTAHLTIGQDGHFRTKT